MNITIRNIEERDFECVVRLIKDFADFEKQPSAMKNSVALMSAEKDSFHAFVATSHNDTIIGYVFCFFAYYTWEGRSLYMDDLYVCPEFRGKGVGTMLLKKVMEHARENMCHKLRWQVSKWNEPAIDFYTKIGARVSDGEMNCDLPT